MTQQAKAEIIKHYRKQYKRAVKSEKSRMIDMIAESTGYSRKHIIHALNDDVHVPTADHPRPSLPLRTNHRASGEDLGRVQLTVWQAA